MRPDVLPAAGCSAAAALPASGEVLPRLFNLELPVDNPEQSGSHFNRQLAMVYGPRELPQGNWACQRNSDKAWRIYTTGDYLAKGWTAIRLVDLPSGDTEITPG